MALWDLYFAAPLLVLLAGAVVYAHGIRVYSRRTRLTGVAIMAGLAPALFVTQIVLVLLGGAGD